MNAITYIQSMFQGKALPSKSARISEWLSWYRGDVMNFHRYKMYNGTNHIECERKGLQMAKHVCESWANLLLNERCDIVMPKAQKKKFDAICNRTNFWSKGNEGIEKSFALGMGAFVVGVSGLKKSTVTDSIMAGDNSQVTLDFVNALKIQPITIENKIVTETAFISGGNDVTYVVVHYKNKQGNYVIRNAVIDHKADKVIEEYEFDTKSPIAWFQIVRPNLSSNIMTDAMDEEIGMSVFANSIDTLKAIDTTFDSFDNEITLSRRRVFLDVDAYRVDIESGQRIKSFDPYETQWYTLPRNEKGDNKIEEHASPIRQESYISTINAQLSYLASKCGLGENYYKFEGSANMTATQVISENSTLFRTVKKHEILLENVLRNLTKAIIYASTNFTKDGIGEVKDEQIVIKFDDSIIEDKETEMKRDRMDVQSGLMSDVEYRMKWYGEDEKSAMAYISKHFRYRVIDQYSTALQSGLITPQEFVNIVYHDMDEAKQKELELYVSEFLLSSKSNAIESIYGGDEGRMEEEDEQEEVNQEEEEEEVQETTETA